MKAIHNDFDINGKAAPDVLNISKILNESNSQHWELMNSINQGCSQYFKDTK